MSCKIVFQNLYPNEKEFQISKGIFEKLIMSPIWTAFTKQEWSRKLEVLSDYCRIFQVATLQVQINYDNQQLLRNKNISDYFLYIEMNLL